MNSKLKLSVVLRGIVAESFDHAGTLALDTLGRIAHAIDADIIFRRPDMRVARELNGTYTVMTP